MSVDTHPEGDARERPQPRRPILIPIIGRSSLPADRLLARFGLELFARPLASIPVAEQLPLDQPRRRVIALPDTFHNQAEPRKRPPMFRGLHLPFGDRRFDPRSTRYSDGELIAYCDTVFDVEIERGSSILLQPAHRAPSAGKPAREVEVRLAMLAAQTVVDRGLLSASPDDPYGAPREFFCSILATPSALRHGSGEELLQAYAGVQCNAYWCGIAGLDEDGNADDVFATSEWLFRLQHITNRRVFVVCPGNLCLAFLASGLAGAAIGLASGERLPWPRGFASGSERLQRIYHPRLLQSIVCGPASARATLEAGRAFGSFPCRCGYHPSNRPPVGDEQRVPHAAACRLGQAAEVLRHPPEEREEVLRGWISDAAAAAEHLALASVNEDVWAAVAAGRRAADGRDERADQRRTG